MGTASATTSPAVTLTAMPIPAPPRGHVLAAWGLWHPEGGWEIRPDPGDLRAGDNIRRRLMGRGWVPLWAARHYRS